MNQWPKQTVAAIFALLNDVRLSQGRTALGFINPLIYSASSGFTDIVSGSNPGCGTKGKFGLSVTFLDSLIFVFHLNRFPRDCRMGRSQYSSRYSRFGHVFFTLPLFFCRLLVLGRRIS